jgi:hypothetical protein
MSSEIIDRPNKNTWQIHGVGWELEDATSLPPYVSENRSGLTVKPSQATSGNAESLPSAERRFDSPQSFLSGREELRFWLRSDLPASSSPDQFFYLAFEVAYEGANGSGESWQRLLPVKQRQIWELHRLWLGDMPETLRQSVNVLRLSSFSLDRAKTPPAFIATIGDLLATRLEVLKDVDGALLARLDKQFQVKVPEKWLSLPAVVVMPESGQQEAKPYIRITPWSIQPNGERGGSGDLVDNYTVQNISQANRFGAYTRPPPWLVQVEYAIEVIAVDRSQVTLVLGAILSSFSRNPFLIANGEPWALTPFKPSPEESANLVSSGRTPLFYRIATQVETGDRQLQLQPQQLQLQADWKDK